MPSSSSSRKVLGKKKRPPGIRAADMLPPTAPPESPEPKPIKTPTKSPVLKIRIPPISPTRSLVIEKPMIKIPAQKAHSRDDHEPEPRENVASGGSPVQRTDDGQDDSVMSDVRPQATPQPSAHILSPPPTPAPLPLVTDVSVQSDAADLDVLDGLPGVDLQRMDGIEDTSTTSQSASAQAVTATADAQEITPNLPTTSVSDSPLLIQSSDASRKRALSVSVNDAETQPLQQRRRTGESAPPEAPAPTEPPSQAVATSMDVDAHTSTPPPPPPAGPAHRLMTSLSKEEGELTPSSVGEPVPLPPQSPEPGQVPELPLPLARSITLESGEITQMNSPHPNGVVSGGDEPLRLESKLQSLVAPSRVPMEISAPLPDGPLPSTSASSSLTNGDPQVPNPVYGSEVQILGIVWGSSKTETSELKFVLRKEDAELLDRCISLATYQFEDLRSEYNRSGAISAKELEKVRPVAWQSTFKLQMRINDGPTAWICPPMFSPQPNVDHILDLTSRPTPSPSSSSAPNFHSGPNTVILIQQGGLLNSVWVLVLHSPSPAQLTALEAERQKEAEWRSFVEGLRAWKLPPLVLPAFLDSVVG
ncbi:hypothetical protein BXZ70DRAFT_146942 [Cristinia sonorae]|uniref:Uncharacterized protein n=1 Tax=Cristinia sonorae TaxID=1940300 RepID=A0A8K0XQU0_9AGAR|nr:hypothetical protein BXZ70DRAFT_146942 [Cristinia sonorae]